MKYIFLIFSLSFLSLQSIASSNFCAALKIIIKNEPNFKGLNSNYIEINTLPIVQETRLAYYYFFKEAILSAKSGSSRYFYDMVQDCKIQNKKALFETITSSQFQRMWSQEDFELIKENLKNDKMLTENIIHNISWSITTIGGVGLLIGLASGGELLILPVGGVVMMFAGEVTSFGTWLYNRSPSFAKRAYLRYLGGDQTTEIDNLSALSADARVSYLLEKRSSILNRIP